MAFQHRGRSSTAARRRRGEQEGSGRGPGKLWGSPRCMPCPAGQAIPLPDLPFLQHNCDRNISHSPYRVRLGQITETAQGHVYCFEFFTVECLEPGNECCTADLYKVEMPVRESCHALVFLRYL
eukprot:168334-Chlamydomonas_euryale.AAC.3